MSSIIFTNISNIREKRSCYKNDYKEIFKKQDKLYYLEQSLLRSKRKNSSESTDSHKIIDKKKIYRKYFRKRIYRPIKIKKVLGCKVIDKKVILTYCDEKGEKMESTMDELMKDPKYFSLVFDYFNRRQTSMTTHFESGFYNDKNS